MPGKKPAASRFPFPVRKQRYAPSGSHARKLPGFRALPTCAETQEGSEFACFSICLTGVINSRRTFNILQDRHASVNPFFGEAPNFFVKVCESFTKNQRAFPLRGRWHPASPAGRMTDEVAAVSVQQGCCAGASTSSVASRQLPLKGKPFLRRTPCERRGSGPYMPARGSRYG